MAAVDDKDREFFQLRSIEDLTTAGEWLFNKQRSGSIDAKAADGMNTTLKNQIYLTAKLRLDAAKIILAAKIKKVDIPAEMLPDLTATAGKKKL